MPCPAIRLRTTAGDSTENQFDLCLFARFTQVDGRGRWFERAIGRAPFVLTMSPRHEACEEPLRPPNIVGNAPEMRRLYLTIRQIAPSDATVLIRGEPGTGKELVAAAIHDASRRARGPLVTLHCATLSADLLESKLFGSEEGDSPGAPSGRAGCMKEAEGGTLFLHEIGACSPAAQVKVLRVLQEREYEPLDRGRPIAAGREERPSEQP